MDHTYWRKQTAEQPLFPDVLWSRPENKLHAGKLLIIGGNLHGFSAPAEAYAASEQAGIGVARVLLPDALNKTVGGIFPEAFFAPSTPSGSFARQTLDTWLELAEWADGVLLSGDFGKNSETAIVLESFVEKYTGILTLTDDALDYFLHKPMPILNRPETIIAPTFVQLQKIISNSGFAKALTSDLALLQIVEILHEFTEAHLPHIVLYHSDTYYTASNGAVHTSSSEHTALATYATVWALQHPHSIHQAITTSLVVA